MRETTTMAERKILFSHQDHGYHTHRIPALVRTVAGTLLLFWEGRKESTSDFGHIHLLVSSSEDGGESWSDPAIVHHEGTPEQSVSIGNATPVVDTRTGAVVLVFTRDNEGVFATKSEDDGRTWATPQEITSQVRPGHWKRYWTGPGHGIQLRYGTHAGRLVMPSYHLEPYRPDGPDICHSHAVYSDDHGASWHIGGNTPQGHGIEEIVFEAGWWPNGFVWAGCECLAAELHDGELYLTVRNQVAYAGRKAYARSYDGGESWTPLALQPELPGPRCQSGLLRLTNATAPERDHLLFTGIASSGDPGGRRDLTLYQSVDGGLTWPRAQVLHPGPSGYSDLCELPDGRVLCVYEAGDQRYNERLEMVIINQDSLRSWCAGHAVP